MTKEIDTLFEELANAYVAAKKWSEKNNRSAVHIIKTHYKDPVDKQDRQNLNSGKQNGRNRFKRQNEWHYMKDVNCYEDLRFPLEEEWKGKLLIWKVQVITEKGVKKPVCYHCGSYDDLWYEINAYHVIAWKEIVPPKEE